MSYIDVPRIHFAGKFYSNPSTVDNTPGNYDPANPIVPQWNPSGTHYFFFQNCKITAAVSDPSGVLKTSSSDDALIGGTVQASSTIPAQAKLVDLDSEWQNSSQIWGMKMAISFANGSVEGEMDTATLRDLWFARVPSGPNIPKASGMFQSVVRNLTWQPVAGPTPSPAFEKWRMTATTLLSIKFVAYAYDPPTYTGKIVGTIGAGQPNEPVQILNARRLEPSNNPNLSFGPRNYFGPFGPAPFKLDETRKRLVIDLGNAIPETAPGGARPAVGNMKARVMPSAGGTIDLGTLDYSQSHYETSAGVEELTLTDAQIAVLKSRPLEIFVDGPAAKPVILSERPTGTNIETTETAFRMNPGDTRTIDLFATAFGAPKSGQTINARLTTGGARTSAGLTFTVLGGGKTDANGRLQIKFTASDPGKVRLGGKLDGQIFFVEFDWGKAAVGAAADWRGRMVIKVFDTRAAVASPKWADVKDIFEEFARLYPSMKGILDLSVQATVQTAKDRIKTTLTYPETDPRFMPVSRDLSRDKRDLILRWIAAGAP